MKKNATRYCAGPAYYRMCSTDVYCSKQTAAEWKPSPIISSFLGIGQKKTVDAAKICGGAENVVKKQKPGKTFVNGLLGFITLGIYTRKRACSHIVMSCPSIRATLSALLINILWVPSSCFCIVISLSLRVK